MCALRKDFAGFLSTSKNGVVKMCPVLEVERKLFILAFSELAFLVRYRISLVKQNAKWMNIR